MQASVKVSAWMLRPRRVSQIPQRGAQALALCSPRKQIKICACRRLTAEKTAQQPAESGCRPGGGAQAESGCRPRRCAHPACLWCTSMTSIQIPSTGAAARDRKGKGQAQLKCAGACTCLCHVPERASGKSQYGARHIAVRADLRGECVCLCVNRGPLICRCALAQDRCVCDMSRRRAP